MFGTIERYHSRYPDEKKHLQNAFNEPKVLEPLGQLLVDKSLSFRLVESPDFAALIYAFNYTATNAIPKLHTTIPSLTHKAFIAHQEAVQSRLQRSLSRIYLNSSMWKSLNRLGFQAICAHFLDGDTRSRRKALLGLRENGTFHGGEPQAEALMRVVKSYGVDAVIGYITTDNGSSNDTLMRALEGSTTLLVSSNPNAELGVLVTLSTSPSSPSSLRKIKTLPKKPSPHDYQASRRRTYYR